ncbi:MAG TPA: phenylalanine 4-monooxygenase [Solirubrobacteraceae bacterium]|nr:phenylalanine 4-monooxygenase [Solirubrobacteraceae bacterium]
MFEEAQLYSPVTTGAGGEVTVHLHDGHPGAADPDYRRRRNEIAAAALAWRPGEPAPVVEYHPAEQDVWRTVCRELAPLHSALAVDEYQDALARLALPVDRIPSLDEVSARLVGLSGWTYVPAAGLVDLRTFYAALADRTFHSTQYVRHPAMPLYTPEPDIIHEVLGHGHLLATPTFGALHRRAGAAAIRLRDEASLRVLSRVFWFTLEFGVVVEHGELRAYGAGILSSFGEMGQFRDMELRPLALREMGTADYDITKYQPVLYRAESVAEIEEVVGGFFDTCTDESIQELRHEHAVA